MESDELKNYKLRKRGLDPKQQKFEEDVERTAKLLKNIPYARGYFSRKDEQQKPEPVPIRPPQYTPAPAVPKTPPAEPNKNMQIPPAVLDRMKSGIPTTPLPDDISDLFGDEAEQNDDEFDPTFSKLPEKTSKTSQLEEAPELAVDSEPAENLDEFSTDPVIEEKVPAVVSDTKFKDPKWIFHDNRHPTLYDLASYVRLPVDSHKRIIGEEQNCIIAGLCMIAGIPFGIEGKAGSSKTICIDKILNLIPEDYIYNAMMGSQMGFNYDADNINGKRLFYAAEINHLIPASNGSKESSIEKTLKLLGEGKSAELTVTKGQKPFKIKIDPINVAYTRAIENPFDIRPELRRRFVVVETSTSADKIMEIHMHKNQDRHKIFTDTTKNQALVDMLKEHFTELIDLKEFEILDPFSDYLHLNSIIPRTEKSSCYIDQYHSMLDACAKFHFFDRKKILFKRKENGKVQEKLVLFLNLEDHFYTYNLFHSKLVESLGKYEDDEYKNALTQINKPDWKEYFAVGVKEMQNNDFVKNILKKEPDFLKQWYDSQVTVNTLYTTDIMTGDKIKITDV
jgi:hypothetical protein